MKFHTLCKLPVDALCLGQAVRTVKLQAQFRFRFNQFKEQTAVAPPTITTVFTLASENSLICTVSLQPVNIKYQAEINGQEISELV